MVILFHLADGARRYVELTRAIAASNKVLIQPLKELQADGVIDRFDHSEIPPNAKYSLTLAAKPWLRRSLALCEWPARMGDRCNQRVKSVASGWRRSSPRIFRHPLQQLDQLPRVAAYLGKMRLR
jgi:DNA-binding HxlR family transcriptional regulator